MANRRNHDRPFFLKRTYLPIWFVLVGIAIAFAFAEIQQRTIEEQRARAEVQNQAGLLRARLEGAINSDMQLVRGLVAVVAAQPQMDQSEFSRIAADVIGDRTDFINIAVAPDLVVQMVYPFEPNLSVIGLNYNLNDAQRDAALRARDSGEMVLAGPVDLIQGGRGFIGRFPIFLTDQGNTRFWGIVSAVLDVDAIYQIVGLTNPDLDLDIALLRQNQTGGAANVFHGDSSILESDPVLMDVTLPSGNWQMAVIPKGGWTKVIGSPWQMRAVLAIASLLIALPTLAACYLAATRNRVIATLSKRERELEAKREELENLSLVAENASDSIILSDRDARIVWVNRAFENMTGYSAGEAIGKTPGELLNGPLTDSETIEEIIAHRDAGEPLRTEILNYTKSGQEIWVETRIVPVQDETGEVSLVIGVERDITDQKRHEHELSEAKMAAENADQAKSEFLANMSHEIRTPMNGIIGMAELLWEKPLPAEERKYVESILSSSNALLKIINDILDLSRLEAGKLSVIDCDFDLKRCVDGAVELLTPALQQKGLAFAFEYDANLPERVRADDGRLRQILVNLIGNAIKFTHDGTITLRAKSAQDDPFRLVFAVEDTGIGLSESQQSKIFDRFAQADGALTRNFGGTGLGLTISKLLAEEMGGGISVTSQVGKGSVFTAEIQTKQPESSFREKGFASFKDVGMLCCKKVLVADDNATNRLLVRKFLADTPVEFLEAENGRRAVELFKEQRPDIILMDMRMPEMDGLAAARAIRALPVRQPNIVALTANAYASDRKACGEAGMDAFLSKPIRKNDLLATLGSFVDMDHDAKTCAKMTKP